MIYSAHIRQVLLCMTLLLSLQFGRAQAYFDYDEAINQAYQHITALDLDRGKAILDSLTNATPDNLAILHMANYVDFLTLFIYERESDFSRLKANKKARLQAIRSRSQSDDPFAAFAEAEILLQWALVRSKFDELVTSARELYQAYNLLEKAKQNHPDFLLYNKSLSIIHALVETIPLPALFKNIMGISGTIAQGVDEINSVLASESAGLFFQESEVILAFIKLYQQNKPDEAWAYYMQSEVGQNPSPLAKFVGVKLAQRSGKNTLALEIMSDLTDVDYQKLPYLSFLQGLCRLRVLDPSAKEYLLHFVNTFEGRHYIKEAYQKLGWSELVLNDNVAGYKTYMDKCIKLGHDLIDDDKQALKEANKDYIPHPDLLIARLLFDGGKYQEAAQHLVKKAHLFYYHDLLRAEYLYRMGRIAQKLYNYPDALTYYKEILSVEAYQSSFYACNAALQIGIIYESQQQVDLARLYFEECLSLNPDDYQNSLHQKAKSGLIRIKT